MDKLKIHKIKILAVFLGVLVFAGAVFGAYKFGRRQIQPGPQPTPTPGVTCGPCSQLMPPHPDFCKDGTIIPGEKDECGCQMPPKCQRSTANWKTCTNKNYSFSIKYPANFEIDPSTCNYAIMDYNLVKDINIVDTFEDFRKNWLLTINVEKSALGLDQWIKDKNLCPSSFESCSGQVAGPITNSIEVDLINRHYAETDVIVKKNDTILDFSLNARNPNTPVNSGIKNVLDQILSTFKFLPSASTGQRE